MSSDAFEQFAEEFGCWITDHGLTGADGGEVRNGVVRADVDLPMLESAIHDLIAEARAQVARDVEERRRLSYPPIPDDDSFMDPAL